jgi:hypothetical protein
MQLWDAVVCAAAIDAGKSLLTEDMQDGRTIKALRLLNPFTAANAEVTEALLACDAQQSMAWLGR